MQLHVAQYIENAKSIKLKYVFLGLLFICLLLIKWYFGGLYQSLLNSYINLLSATSSIVLKGVGVDNVLFNSNISLNNGVNIVIDRTFFDAKVVIGVLAIVLFYSNKKQNYFLPLLFILWVVFFNIFRITVLFITANKLGSVLMFNRDSFYLLFLYLFPLLFFGKPLLKKVFYKKTDFKAILLKITAAFFTYHLFSFFYKLIAKGNHVIADALSDIILFMSTIMLNFLEYNVEVVGRNIANATSYIAMGTPCIGIEIMLVFALVILVSDSIKLKNLLYIVFGTFSILFLNAFRVVFLFIHVAEGSATSQTLKMDHDIYNLAIYGLILGLWYYWYNYFRKEDVLKIQ